MAITSSLYDVIRRPLITEKSAIVGAESNSVVFEVHPRATKEDVRLAVEKVFDVQVAGVRTINVPKKRKGRQVRASGGQRVNSWKKAYVKLQPGSNLNVIEGL